MQPQVEQFFRGVFPDAQERDANPSTATAGDDQATPNSAPDASSDRPPMN